LSDFLNGALDVQLFCTDVEAAYNEAVDHNALTPVEQEAFEELFDEVVWYSPGTPETWEYPHYRKAEQIKAAATKAAARLQQA
jgi:hypothetical protein